MPIRHDHSTDDGEQRAGLPGLLAGRWRRRKCLTGDAVKSIIIGVIPLHGSRGFVRVV